MKRELLPTNFEKSPFHVAQSTSDRRPHGVGRSPGGMAASAASMKGRGLVGKTIWVGSGQLKTFKRKELESALS
jgi:hypothetical protein